MRRVTSLLIVGIIGLVSGVSVAGPTQAGSSKSSDGNLTCGNKNELANIGGVGIYGNTNGSSQSELEACNDGGAPNSQGRLVVRVNHNTSNPGVRVSLDSDRDQTPSNICCSYINAQVGTEGSGVWCGEDGNPNGVPGDGYSRPWSSPGDDGSPSNNEPGDAPGPAECIPTQ